MNIPLIPQCTSHRCFSTGVLRLLAVFGAALLGPMSTTSGAEESGFLSRLTQASTAPKSPPLGRQFTHGNEAFRVVKTSQVRTVANSNANANINANANANVGASQPPSIRQAGYASDCVSCGSACGGTCGPVSSCSSCGTPCGGACGGSYNGDFSSRYGGGSFASFASACATCDPFWYGSFEALYMDRDGDGRYSLSPSFSMGGFDTELAGRLTIGSVPDCVNGWELSFAGPLRWNMAGGLVNVGGNIQTFLLPGANLIATDLSAFNDTATSSAQSYRAEFWNVEANRTLMGWDVAKLICGVRYINYDERFSYFSQNATESGLLRSTTDNQMYGLHTGMDLLYPISRHAYTDFRARFGAFANFVDSNVRLVNNGVTHIANSDDTNKLSGIVEIGGGLRYQLGPSLSVRAGAELWYLTRVATANDQFTNVVSPLTSGQSVRSSDDVIISGVSLGAEFRF